MSNSNRKMRILQQKHEKHVYLPEISIPGVQNLYQAVGKGRKLTWISALSFCLLIALFQIANRIEFFINGSIAVRVSVDQNEKLNLPDITLCPPMDFNRSVEIANLMEIFAEKFKVNTTSIFDLLRLPQTSLDLLWNMTKLTRNGFLIKSLNETITNNFTFEYWPSIYGSCVTLRKKEHFPTFSLPEILIELTNTGWILPNNAVIKNGIQMAPPVVTAYKVILHDKPLTLYDVGVFGHRCFGFVRLKLTSNVIKYSFLNNRKSPCSETAEILIECRVKCLNNILRQHIRCRLPYHPMADIPQCPDAKTSILSNETSYKIMAEFTWAQCACPRLCSGLSFSTLQDTNWMYSNKMSFVHVLLRFQDATVDTISEYYAYTLVSLLCDVGSILGLMLGICALTFIQILEVIFYYFNHKIKNKNKKTKRIIKVCAISH